MYEGKLLSGWFDHPHTERAVRQMVEYGKARYLWLAVHNTPIGEASRVPGSKYVPGKLRAGWYATGVETAVTARGAVALARIVNPVDYAEMIEHGWGLWGPKHAKYEIHPKKPGGWLRFWSRQHGKVVFAKKVMHPGAPGQHMLMIATAKTEHEIHEITRPALDWWAHEIENGNKRRYVVVGR